MENKYYLLCYTRHPQEDPIYSEKLAYSMHLALSEDGEHFTALNHNSGILYAKAVVNPDGTLHAKSLKEPKIIQRADGSFGVVAKRIEVDGSLDKELRELALAFSSEDLIHYQELGAWGTGKPEAEELLHEAGNVMRRAIVGMKGINIAAEGGEVQGISAKEADTEGISVMAECGSGQQEAKLQESIRRNRYLFGEFKAEERAAIEAQLTGAIPGNIIEISREQAERLKCRFLTPVNTANEVPKSVPANNRQELDAVRAVAYYSDGSSMEKKVDWYADAVDFDKPGEYEVYGKVHQEQFPFPVAWDRADPCIGKWDGKYYFIATNDADGNNSLYIREADTIPGLITAQEVKILDTQMYPHLKGLLWAPEFHIINGRLYIFHAGTPGPFEKEQSHVMALKTGGNPMRAQDWEMPVRVERQDGSMLYGEQGITLDMTEFESAGVHYVCWSQRQFFPVDQGAWLYIATLNPDKPWQLASNPVLLSRPEYGWANNHTFVDEGPFAIKKDGMIYMTFSSAAVDSTYVTGLLTAREGDDLLNPENWVKENCPLLSSRSVPSDVSEKGLAAAQSRWGEFGPGHNSFVQDEEGVFWFVYHARRGVNGERSSGLRRLHFNSAGFPVLDMTKERDLKPELTWVRTKVIVRG
ncbi:MAG: family 43 glycosylhydrolase [Lachnospiraceae bacterium]|nr:family 43 glycosylhydrolase [Lachnospiraceae bacterium]